MKKREQEKDPEAELEREMRDDAAWERAPEGAPARRETLASQVTLRLGPDDAAKLRRVAQQLEVGYTSLLRQWIVERLALEDRCVTPEGSLHRAGTAATWADAEFTYQTPTNRIAVEVA